MIIRLTNINKTYKTKFTKVDALRNIDLSIEKGEYITIMGPSGSGKSTLMNIIGCMDIPTEGEYVLNGTNVEHMTDDELAYIRNKEIGFVFQAFNLIPRLNVLENTELPLIYSGIEREKRLQMASAVLKSVGIPDKENAYPNQLSGGQRQRVAIARALITNPSIILADEPTGALDQKTGKEILALFRNLNESGNTIIVVTHDPQVAENGTRTVNIIDGKIS